MSNQLVLTVRFLHPYSHGRGESGDPEWPPSPLRLLQALLAAAASHWNERQELIHAVPAMRWLESLPPPVIKAVVGIPSKVRTQFYVPDNTTELLVPAWKKGELDKVPKRTEKVVRSTHLLGEAIHYLFELPAGECPHLEILRTAARSITHLGWGIDMAVGDATIIDAVQATELEGIRWHPSSAGGIPLRVPKVGTLDDLARKHTDFLSRITEDGFRPVPPLRVFDIVRYRRDTDALPRHFAVFKLVDENDDTVAYPQSKFIHIAGMVRHLAIDLMKKNPPRDLRGYTQEKWVEHYVAGHQSNNEKSTGVPHSQFSYVPLPSIGHAHTNPSVRRTMVVAPLGDESWLRHLQQRLDGLSLKPLPDTTLPPGTRLELVPKDRADGVREAYTCDSHRWASVTPVILPGHDDHKPNKTRKLIEKALAQSGIDQLCTFEWSPFSRFRKSFSAHKYDKNKRLIGYNRPDHLSNQSAVHLQLEFKEKFPGPITIGAGRHCGFGLFAAVDE